MTPPDSPRSAGHLIFFLIVLASAAGFGAVDRPVQCALLALFGLGVLCGPRLAAARGGLAGALFWALLGLLLLKEFLPAAWTGAPPWRAVAERDYGLVFPWTRNAEPGRAVEGVALLGLAALWFLWVRSLASVKQGLAGLAWAMLGSAAAVAALSLAYGHGPVGSPIFGIRETPGWRGFGPFPNRNHTANFLAMGALAGAGCILRALVRRRFLEAALGAGAAALALVAMLESGSRGGMLAFAVGVATFGALMLWRLPGFRTGAAVAAGVALAATLVLASGGAVLARFAGGPGGDLATNLRWDVWRDVCAMWRASPWFGHGLGSFRWTYPLVQQVRLHNEVVLHPESSWLQWLAEMGAIPLLLLAALPAALAFAARGRGREPVGRFALRAGAAAACAATLAHCIWDVPGHRWGTGAMALAALGIALPAPANPRLLSRALALLPLAAALGWLLPLWRGIPACSPGSADRAITLYRTTDLLRETDIRRLLRWFPLNPELHRAAGVEALRARGDRAAAWRHFRAAVRLKPNSWSLPATLAMACRPISPGMSLHFWSTAVERAGPRAEDVLFMAWNHSAVIPGADAFWGRFAEAHPGLLISMAVLTAGDDARYFFRQWWNRRATADDLAPFEIAGFYGHVLRLGSREDLTLWMRAHPDLAASDTRRWAGLLRAWGDWRAAWDLVARQVPEPEFPAPQGRRTADDLQREWNIRPHDFLLAQDLAATLAREGNAAAAHQIVVAAARRPGAPDWFRRKAAHLEAGAGDLRSALELLIGPED